MERLKDKIQWLSYYNEWVPMLVQTSQLLVLWLSPTPWCFCGRKSAGMVLPDLHKQHCHLPLTSPVISPLFLMKEWQVWVISLGMWPITVKLFLWCTATAYLSCSLSSSQNISSYSPTQGLHMHLYRWCHAFHYKLVSRSGVPLPCSRSPRCLDRHWLNFLLVTLNMHW